MKVVFDGRLTRLPSDPPESVGPRESVRHAAGQNLSLRRAEKRVNLSSAPYVFPRMTLSIPRPLA